MAIAALVLPRRLSADEVPCAKEAMRRLLIFLHGYDPRASAFYYKLYRNEAAKYAARTNRPIEVDRPTAAEPGLTTFCVRAGGTAETLVEIHSWDAIARAHWTRGEFGGVLETLRFSWLFLRTGQFRRLLRANRRAGLVALWPLFTILVPLAFTLLGVALLCLLLEQSLGWPWWIGLATLPPALFGLLRGIYAFDRFSQIFWVARTLAFYGDEAHGKLPDYEHFKERVAAHLVNQIKLGAHDEILVVGHSVGAALAVSIIGRALALDRDLARHRAKISLLTLGQAMPVLGCFPEARTFHAELGRCALADGLDWVNVTSGADLACFHRVDPVSACGIDRPPGAAIRPKLLSARFHRLFSGESYARLKKTALVHQLYLMAPESPGGYEFFEITAGPLTLDQRFPVTTS